MAHLTARIPFPALSWSFSYGNLISGNTTSGVYLTGASSTKFIEGNFIGTDSTGKVRLPNGSGVLIDSGSCANDIGGENELALDLRIDSLAGNIISGNTGQRH